MLGASRQRRMPGSSGSGWVPRPPRRRSIEVTLTGVVYLGMALTILLGALNTPANLLYAVFGLMLGVLLVSLWIGRTMLRGVRIERVIPESCEVGRQVTLLYRVSNNKRFWPSLSVTIAELDGAAAFVRQPVAYMFHTAARMTSTVATEVIPRRRGLHDMDRYQISSAFPFGFVRRAAIRRQPDAILIYPAMAQVDPKLLRRCRATELNGPDLRPQRGGTDEFYGLKEHRAGDNPRWIYWRRSARTGVLVAKEMTRSTPPRLLLVVDTYLATRALSSHAAVERVIAMAASLAYYALEAGLAVGLCAWSSGAMLDILPQTGKRHLRDMLAALARLSLNQDADAGALLKHARQVLVNDSSATAILLSADPSGGGGSADQAGTLVIVAGSEPAQRWFRFDPAIDFAGCVPPDQAASIAADAPRSQGLVVDRDAAVRRAAAPTEVARAETARQEAGV